MKKNMLYVVLIFISFMVFIVTLNFSPSTKNDTQRTQVSSNTQNITTHIQPDIALSLNPETKTVKKRTLFSVSIQAASQTKMLAVDLYLSYSKDTLRVLSIAPGDYFVDPKILAKKLDDTDGTIVYSLASLTPQKKSGAVATITLLATKTGMGTLSISEKTLASMKGALQGKITVSGKGEYKIE